MACGGPEPQDTQLIIEEAQDEDPIQVDSEICQDYLDCLAATDPDALASKESNYGLVGSCWQSGEVDRCETVCAKEHAALWEENPREPACGELSLCPQGGRWNMYFGQTPAGCSYSSTEVALECVDEGGTWYFDLNAWESGERLWTCDGVGGTAEFTCKSKIYASSAQGTFAEDYQTVTGTYTVARGDDCDGVGAWYLDRPL